MYANILLVLYRLVIGVLQMYQTIQIINLVLYLQQHVKIIAGKLFLLVKVVSETLLSVHMKHTVKIQQKHANLESLLETQDVE